jgi:hypothetical protein
MLTGARRGKAIPVCRDLPEQGGDVFKRCCVRDSSTAHYGRDSGTHRFSINVSSDSNTGMPQSSVALAISFGLRPRRLVSASCSTASAR